MYKECVVLLIYGPFVLLCLQRATQPNISCHSPAKKNWLSTQTMFEKLIPTEGQLVSFCEKVTSESRDIWLPTYTLSHHMKSAVCPQTLYGSHRAQYTARNSQNHVIDTWLASNDTCLVVFNVMGHKLCWPYLGQNI